jgi:abequosyltransferase
MTAPFLSICIPSYNRPKQLGELLTSIKCNPVDIEIVICEDFAPRRIEVEAVVYAFVQTSVFQIHYHENPINRGFDGNLRNLVECASGE